MGCGVSRLDGNGFVFPAKLRPVFLHRLEEIKMRRHSPALKDASPTPSKKELLLHNDVGDDDSDKNNNNITIANNCHENPPKESMNRDAKSEDVRGAKDDDEDRKKEDVQDDIDQKKESNYVSEIEDGILFTDAEKSDDEEDDDEDDDERMIGRDYDGAFPGSPSFRVYFKDDGEDKHNDTGRNDAFKVAVPADDGTELSKEGCEKTKVKRGRKRRSFRRVMLPKGGQAAMKNLLSVKSCYTPSPSPSPHDQAHLLTAGKTTA